MKYEIQIMPQNEVTTTNRDWEIAIVRANALHGQITGLTGQIQTLEQKRWMTAVVLGGLLARMKAAAQHGEWKALFTKNDTCVVFDKRTGDYLEFLLLFLMFQYHWIRFQKLNRNNLKFLIS